MEDDKGIYAVDIEKDTLEHLTPALRVKEDDMDRQMLEERIFNEVGTVKITEVKKMLQVVLDNIDSVVEIESDCRYRSVGCGVVLKPDFKRGG